MGNKHCMGLYPMDDIGVTFCRKKKNHKGPHSALVEWKDED